MASQTHQGPQPWDRQPDETPQAYRAFRAWLDTVPANERSVVETYRRLYGGSTAAKPAGYFSAWTKKYRWGARALEWDNHCSRIAQEAELKVIAQETKLWAERRKHIARRDFEQADKLRDKVDQIIALPVVRQTLTNTDVSEDGRTTVNHYTIEPVSVRAADAATILKLLSERQRLAAEMVTDIVQTVDSQTPEQKRLAEARRTLAEMRERYPNLEEGQRLEMVASTFDGVTVDDLSEPGEAVTSSELVQ